MSTLNLARECDIADASTDELISGYAAGAEDQADRLASIDEDEDECDITEHVNVNAHSPIAPNIDSIKRWKAVGKLQLNEGGKLGIVNEDQEVFQSETTLIESKEASHQELPHAKEDIFSSFKTRIAKFWERPMEKLYGKQHNAPGPELIKPSSNSKKGMSTPKIKALMLEEVDQHHKKSTSLLDKISHRLQGLKPFNENSAKPVVEDANATMTDLTKIGKNDESASIEEDQKSTYGSEAEYLKAIKSRKIFEGRYRIIKELGSGGHSTVYMAEKVADGSKVVCKFIKKSSVWRWYRDPYDGTKIPFEIHVMRKFRDEKKLSVIQYHEHYALGAGRFVIVMEYLGEEWCDLYDYVEKYGPVKESHSRHIFAQVVETIERMHWLGYLHNDIKDENIMINMKTRELKLIDFGSCTPLVPGKMAKLFYGTKKFAAPEALQNEVYDPEGQEVWALGTLLYVLLFKMDPFKTDQDIIETNIAQKIQRLRVNGYNSYTPIDISDESVDVMLAMLQKDPKRRILLKDIKNSEFFHIKL